METSGI